MARLTISEASRQTGVARTTLYRDIRSGRLSIDAERRIDTAELLRVGYTLRSVAQRPRDVSLRPATTEQSVAQRPIDTRATLLQQEQDLLQRERDLLQRELDAARAREHAAAERERLHQEELAWLRRQFEQMQQRYDRLLEAPRPPPPAQVSSPVARATPPGALPATWQRVLAFMRTQGPLRPHEVQQALGLDGSPRHMMNRMVQAGLLVRVAPGVYEVREEEHHG